MQKDRPIAHRIYFPDLTRVADATKLRLDGPEAHHAARVKRARAGEMVALFDGRGEIAHAEVLDASHGKNASLDVRLLSRQHHVALEPRLEIWCPPPKGDRLETMVDQLSQIGAACWRPLRTARSERDAFRAEKIERAAIESAKQCGRAWLIEIGDWIDFADAIQDHRAVLADASGMSAKPIPSGCVLMLGPEGGWTQQEREQAGMHQRATIRFAPHVMRIETAAVAGAACLLANATLTPGGQP